MISITNVILNLFQDLKHQETRCRNTRLHLSSATADGGQEFGMTMDRGFTLIELMVVLSVTAVLGTLGIAGFTTYNHIQTLQSATSNVVTILNLAKSRAQSQVKPSGLCPGGTLAGYSVIIAENKKYALYLNCSVGGNIKINEQDKVLPQDLSFDSNSSFFFPIQTGGVKAAGQIVISGFGRSKTVIVNSLGGVSIQ